MTCEAQRQSDEMFCARCNMRWDFYGLTVECGKPVRTSTTPTEHESLLRIGKAILGPHSDRHIGRAKMLELRDHMWHVMSTDQERKAAYHAAKAVFDEYAVDAAQTES
jgi:hypothetical protein